MQKPKPFEGERETFPARAFDKFLSTATAKMRAPRAPIRLIYRDAADSNLLLVVGRRGSAWQFKGRTRTGDDGKRHDLTIKIGAPATMTVAQARAAADEIRKNIADGETPQTQSAQRRDARAAAAATDEAKAQRMKVIAAMAKPGGRAPTPDMIKALGSATLAQCAAVFALHGRDHRAKIRQDSWDAKVAQLHRALAECNAIDRLPADLHAPDIDHGLAALTAGTARKRMTAIKALYDWLCRYGATPENPARLCAKLPAAGVRDEFANADELQRIWRYSAEAKPERRDFLRLLILLPLRRGELEKSRVGNITTSNGVRQITIPKENSKTGTEHRLPIVGEAAKIIDRLIDGRDAGELLIPLTTTGKPFEGWTRWQDQVKAATGVEWFYFHSMRKMFSTEAEEHELDEYAIIDACLNHAASATKSGVGRAYNFAKAMPRRADLLAGWDDVVKFAVTTGVWPRNGSHPAPACGAGAKSNLRRVK